MLNKKKQIPRRKLRILILKVLYGNEFFCQDLNSFKKLDIISKEELIAVDDIFVKNRVKEIQKQKPTLDEWIEKKSKNWKKERMSLVDLNIMRLAIFEILFCEDVPDKVALNEAIELAKTFGDQDSPRFINGILDQVLQSKN
ncbi:MAG: transcription antitermination factor NusB [Bdellovibrionales bacterium]|nr:transcription antitermination factor NusB [Bdellovibrionales bacterium]